MLFSPDMLIKVLDGTKTQTRRPVKNMDWVRWSLPSDAPEFLEATHHEYAVAMTTDDGYTIVGIERAGRALWTVGNTCAVCPGRGQKAVGRIRILDIRAQSPSLISDDDACAEGFDSREAFWDKLRALYGVDVDLDALYWALTFELVKEA